MDTGANTREKTWVESLQDDVRVFQERQAIHTKAISITNGFRDGTFSHLIWIGALVTYNDFTQGRVIPDKPFHAQ